MTSRPAMSAPIVGLLHLGLFSAWLIVELGTREPVIAAWRAGLTVLVISQACVAWTVGCTWGAGTASTSPRPLIVLVIMPLPWYALTVLGGATALPVLGLQLAAIIVITLMAAGSGLACRRLPAPIRPPILTLLIAGPLTGFLSLPPEIVLP